MGGLDEDHQDWEGFFNQLRGFQSGKCNAEWEIHHHKGLLDI